MFIDICTKYLWVDSCILSAVTEKKNYELLITNTFSFKTQALLSDYGEKTGNFLYDLSRGHDPEPVTSRQLPKSVGCSKNFSGHLAITDYKKVCMPRCMQGWVRQIYFNIFIDDKLNMNLILI